MENDTAYSQPFDAPIISQVKDTMHLSSDASATRFLERVQPSFERCMRATCTKRIKMPGPKSSALSSVQPYGILRLTLRNGAPRTSRLPISSPKPLTDNTYRTSISHRGTVTVERILPLHFRRSMRITLRSAKGYCKKAFH